MEGALEKLPPSGVLSRYWRLLKGNYSLEDITHQIMDRFSDVSRIVDGIKFTTRDLNSALKELEQDLDKKEAQLLELGSAYADFGQNIKRLTIQRDNIARHMVALEAE